MNKISLILYILLYYCSSPIVFADTNGKVDFHGAIIEAPNCQVTQINNDVQLDCSTNNNNTLSESDIVLNSYLEHLDHKKNRSVMHITYN